MCLILILRRINNTIDTGPQTMQPERVSVGHHTLPRASLILGSVPVHRRLAFLPRRRRIVGGPSLNGDLHYQGLKERVLYQRVSEGRAVFAAGVGPQDLSVHSRLQEFLLHRPIESQGPPPLGRTPVSSLGRLLGVSSQRHSLPRKHRCGSKKYYHWIHEGNPEFRKKLIIY